MPYVSELLGKPVADVDGVILLQLVPLVRRQDGEDHVLDLLRLERVRLEGHEPAVHAQKGRAAGLQVKVRRLLLRDELQKLGQIHLGVGSRVILLQQRPLGAQKARRPRSQARAAREPLDAKKWIAGKLTALDPMEVVFLQDDDGMRIYGYDLKQNWDGKLAYQCPARMDEKLSRSCRVVAANACRALGCRDVARVDLRLDDQGTPWVIEVNPLPGLIPTLWALIVVGTFLGVMAALYGAGLVCWLYGGMGPDVFLARLRDAISLEAFLVGMIKAPFMALVIGVVACVEGLQVQGSAESLGEQTTNSVVKSIFLVIVLDGIFAMFFASIGM